MLDLAIVASDPYGWGGCDYLDISYPDAEPPRPVPVVATAATDDSITSPQSISIKDLCAFVDLRRELSTPPDLHSQCRRRKGKNGGPPRPPNAFIVFRSDFWSFHKETMKERNHREISRIVGRCWKSLEEIKKVPYQKRAKELQDAHALLYPQHKYNLPAKKRATKKAKREENDSDKLCGVVAARVAQDVRASKPPKTPGSSEGGLLDQIIEQKVNLKRPHPNSAVAVVRRASKSKFQFSKPPAKKRKRSLYKPPITIIPVSVARSQTDSPHSSTPFVPTNEIPTLALPPSRNSPVVKEEPLQDPVLEGFARIVALVSLSTLGLRNL